MIFVLDNYDSFTYNLVQYIGVLGEEVRVSRNDWITPKEVIEMKPKGIVISPGPKTPNEAGISKTLIEAAKGMVPVLGICLGHQAIGEVFSAKTILAKEVVHGKSCWITHDQKGIFKGIESPFEAGRYHSLVLDPQSISKSLRVTATTDKNVIMAIQSSAYENIWGLQFHPESILTKENGPKIIRNFHKICYSN